MVSLNSDQGNIIRENFGMYTFDHICKIQRDVNQGTNNWGQPTGSQWSNHLVNLPCHFWSFWPRRERETGEGIVTAQSYMLVPYDTDVTVRDRVTEIKDQFGVKIAGMFNIKAVVYRIGYKHLELESIRSQ